MVSAGQPNHQYSYWAHDLHDMQRVFIAVNRAFSQRVGCIADVRIRWRVSAAAHLFSSCKVKLWWARSLRGKIYSISQLCTVNIFSLVHRGKPIPTCTQLAIARHALRSCLRPDQVPAFRACDLPKARQ